MNQKMIKPIVIVVAILLALLFVRFTVTSMQNRKLCPTDKADMQMIGHDKYGDIYVCQECGYIVRIVE